MPKTTTRHPLIGMQQLPVADVKRLGLAGVEGYMHSPREEMLAYKEVMVSAHGPTEMQELRMNYAATDDEWRRMSIKDTTDYLDMMRDFPHVKKVNIHFSPEQWNGVPHPSLIGKREMKEQTRGNRGEYSRLIDALKEIGAHAAKRKLELTLENHARYWALLPPNTDGMKVDWSKQNRYFGTSPEEWVKIALDINMPNVGLCLDTSHATTYARTFPAAEREKVLFSFLARPDLIRHVHWSDSSLTGPAGLTDAHQLLGVGELPRAFHKAVKALDATVLMETFGTVEETEKQMEFIAGL
ncbi:MAG: sugar phosphate isomerase/epimerase [SAR202 cluster bacterium]|nr:sugar phosphate isomerase/epimerase [SAR202 cluster bacterium]